MKIYLFATLLLLISPCLFAQKEKGFVEINPYARMDWYPQFSYAINPVTTNFVNIRGRNWGINLAYKIPLQKSFYIKAGIGYCKYSFNNIHNYNTSFGNGNARIISYLSIR